MWIIHRPQAQDILDWSYIVLKNFSLDNLQNRVAEAKCAAESYFYKQKSIQLHFIEDKGFLIFCKQQLSLGSPLLSSCQHNLKSASFSFWNCPAEHAVQFV